MVRSFWEMALKKKKNEKSAEENTNDPNPYSIPFSELGENEKTLNITYLRSKDKSFLWRSF